MKSLLLITKYSLLVCVLFFLIMFQGCKYYYKVQTVSKVTPQEIATYDSLNKYIILHKQSAAWHLSHINVSNANLSGNLSVLPSNHLKYKTTKKNRGSRYKHNPRKSESSVLQEVHLYLQDSFIPEFNSGDHIKIAFPDIQKAEIYKKDKGKTTTSWLLPPVITIGVPAIILAATSCPFIYTSDGNSYALTGEIYGGAIYPSLERDDYMLLPKFNAADNQYNLKIANELKERQNTNLVDLMLISHPKNSSVYLDKYGHIQTAIACQAPISAVSLNENDCLGLLKAKDDNYVLFNENNYKTSVNQVILTFENKLGSDTGKLIINAKNSLWADYAYGKFNELLGNYYTKWDEKQRKITKEKQVKRSLKQDIPLSVYLETVNGWKFVDFFNVVGPIASRDMVMAIDVTKAKSKNVRIKLVSGFMFWELGYAAMDFTDNLPVHTTILKPASAIDEKGNNVLSTLNKDDNQRLEQFEIGNEAIVKYDLPQENNLINNYTEQTIYLHSKGYYEKIMDFQGKPNWLKLMSLKHSHSFSKFSLKECERSFKDSEGITMKQ